MIYNRYWFFIPSWWLPPPKPENSQRVIKPTKVRYEDRRKERVKR